MTQPRRVASFRRKHALREGKKSIGNKVKKSKNMNHYCYIYYMTNSKSSRDVFQNSRLRTFCEKVLFVGSGSGERMFNHLSSSTSGSYYLNKRLRKIQDFNLSLHSPNLFDSEFTDSISLKVEDKKQLRVYIITIKSESKLVADLKKYSILLALTSKTKHWKEIPVKRLNTQKLCFSPENLSNLLNVNLGKQFKNTMELKLLDYGLNLLRVATAKQLLGHVKEVPLEEVESKEYVNKKKKPLSSDTRVFYNYNDEEILYLRHFKTITNLDSIIQKKKIRESFSPIRSNKK